MAVNPVVSGSCTVPQDEELFTTSSDTTSSASSDTFECPVESSLEADIRYYSSGMSVDARFATSDRSAKQSQEGYDPLSGAFGTEQPQIDPLTGAYGTPRRPSIPTSPQPAVDPLTGAFGTPRPAVIPALPPVPPTPPAPPETPQPVEPAISARQLRRLEEKISSFETKNTEEKVAAMSRSRVTTNLRDLNEFISELPDIQETQDIRQRATVIQDRLEAKLVELFRAEIEAVPYDDSICDLARTLGTQRVADRHYRTLLDLADAVRASQLDDSQRQPLIEEITRRSVNIEQANFFIDDMSACEAPPPVVTPPVTPAVTPPATNPPDWPLRTPPMWSDPLLPVVTPPTPPVVAVVPPPPPSVVPTEIPAATAVTVDTSALPTGESVDDQLERRLTETAMPLIAQALEEMGLRRSRTVVLRFETNIHLRSDGVCTACQRGDVNNIRVTQVSGPDIPQEVLDKIAEDLNAARIRVNIGTADAEELFGGENFQTGIIRNYDIDFNYDVQRTSMSVAPAAVPSELTREMSRIADRNSDIEGLSLDRAISNLETVTEFIDENRTNASAKELVVQAMGIQDQLRNKIYLLMLDKIGAMQGEVASITDVDDIGARVRDVTNLRNKINGAKLDPSRIESLLYALTQLENSLSARLTQLQQDAELRRIQATAQEAIDAAERAIEQFVQKAMKAQEKADEVVANSAVCTGRTAFQNLREDAVEAINAAVAARTRAQELITTAQQVVNALPANARTGLSVPAIPTDDSARIPDANALPTAQPAQVSQPEVSGNRMTVSCDCHADITERTPVTEDDMMARIVQRLNGRNFPPTLVLIASMDIRFDSDGYITEIRLTDSRNGKMQDAGIRRQYYSIASDICRNIRGASGGRWLRGVGLVVRPGGGMSFGGD